MLTFNHPGSPLRLLIVFGLLLSPSLLYGANSVTPGAIRVDPTFQHLGVVWEISGDDDRDSTFTLEFREAGAGSWRPGATAMRSDRELVVDGGPLGLHHWAASALFLTGGSTYDLRLTLDDPDGGGRVEIVSGTTRVPLEPSSTGRQLFVEPGTGGGDGSAGNPFQGLQAAADAATPGDVFHVGAGTYDGFQISTSGAPGEPIAFLGPSAGEAVVDGGGTTIGVITVGTYTSAPISHILIEGLTIQNGRWGVDAQHSSDVAIRHNVIRDVDFGVLNRRADDRERNQTVCDNIVTGRTPWPQSGIPGERGIDLRGYGNVVCRNRVSDFGDCISVQPLSGRSYGNDIFGNDVHRCVDDGIEIDYNEANVRVWRNRAYNTRMGVSVQPIRGGPAYIFRNELFNQEDKPLKVHNGPAGLVIAHNTSVKLGNGMHDTCGSIWQNAVFRNNLFLGERYAFEFLTAATDGSRDLDFNAWGSSRAGTSAEPWFKWDNVRYDDLDDLRANTVGVEDRGLAASFDDLLDATLPGSWDVEVPPAARDLRLAAGAPEIDAGTDLANLNDPFPLDGLPDVGAFEHGQPPPEYGPRDPARIFADGFERGDLSAWSPR
ncbi:MAG: right-handed parallel beta-helix repeat-containing protein [Acidobacteriota bacterium]